MTHAIGRRLAAVLLVLVTAGATPAAAAEPDLSTPDLAARSFLEAVAAQDVEGMLATSAADDQAAGYRFADMHTFIGSIQPTAMPPSDYPLYASINRYVTRARLLNSVSWLAYSLLTDTPLSDAMVIQVSEAQVDFLVKDVDPSRLEGLRVLDSRLPDPRMTSDQALEVAARNAGWYGADEWTERLVLVSLDDKLFEVGITLMRYGDRWGISSLTSAYGSTMPLRPARPTTQEAYERHTSGDYSDLE